MAFERDVDNEPYPENAYLDLASGDIEWVYENDDDAYMISGLSAEENRANRERFEMEPNSFMLIPGRDHSEHHKILLDFLFSEWTDDENLWQAAHDAYSGSIGRWKKAINDRNVIHAYDRFKDQRMLELAEEFLREQGVEFRWK